MGNTPCIAADLPFLDWLEVVNPSARLGRVRHALFDFDGTLSVIRQGWENIMIPLMIEMICDGQPAPDGLHAEVVDYVDRSTGILTIKQMQWLEEAVQRYGLSKSPRTAHDYKQIYNERLLLPVRKRLAQIDDGGNIAAQKQWMIAGAYDFLQGLYDQGVTLYLASGTDDLYVQQEAAAIGVAGFFGERIYGAKDDPQALTKAQIIQHILEHHHFAGEELLVVGDGPVEIRHAKERQAITLGIAADEVQRQGLAPRKRERLLDAGADFIVTDFLQHQAILRYFVAHQ